MLLSVPIKPNDPGFDKLINALEECSSIKCPNNRKDIIGFLDDIAKKVEERDTVRASVISILKAFSGFPDRFDELIDGIEIYDNGSESFKILNEVVHKIARTQQDLKNESPKTITLCEGSELKNSEEDNNFESLWSELCSILDEIEWKYIWKACGKFENFIRDIDKKRLIKSLCFTKNYEFLKQVFLDQYEPIKKIIKLGEIIEKDNENSEHNEKIKLWLDKAKPKLKGNEALTEHKINKNKCCLPPILLIIIDRLGDGKDQGKWNVRGQFKSQYKQSELLLSPDKQGSICKTFEEIPKIIKKYIDFLEDDHRFCEKNINELRIEVFLPLSEIKLNIDNWAVDPQESSSTHLITKNRIFLRIKERISHRKNVRINLLKKGWEKIDNFLKKDDLDKLAISKASFEEIKKTEETHKHNIIEISRDTNISNWTELIDLMESSLSLWCMNWKRNLPNNQTDRMDFFVSILDSGIPIVFWNWDSIPQEVEKEVNFEMEFKKCLCRDNLFDRCKNLLEKAWRMRRVTWGVKDEIKRQKKPGYYLGMLLEDPEILPEENPLQTIGVN